MDPLTQGLLGAAAAQAAVGGRLPRSAWVIGLAAGVAADLDVLVRPASDPLGGASFHRHFTHAMLFIPVGAAVVAAAFLPWRGFAGKRWWVLAAALVAYATHGALDACTSYGTLLYWPFSNERVAWDWIGIIDPVFSGALLIGVAAAAVRRGPNAARAALVVCVLYMGLGAWQQARVMGVQQELAASRGHVIERGRVMPTPINLVLWRSVYLAEGRLWADSVRMPMPVFGPASEAKVQRGASAEHLTVRRLRAAGYDDPAVVAAFERFNWFADGYVAWDESGAGVVGDMRYATRAERFASLWGLKLPDAGASGGEANAQMIGLPQNRDVSGLWPALMGRDPAFVTLGRLRAGE